MLASSGCSTEPPSPPSEAYDKVKTEVDTAGVSAPDDIEKRVAEILKDRPTLRWDAAVKEVETDDDDDCDG